jgi:hypothetical protein
MDALIAVKFGDVVVQSRLDVAERYAALTLPDVDPRFYSRPEFVQRQDINLENL